MINLTNISVTGTINWQILNNSGVKDQSKNSVIIAIQNSLCNQYCIGDCSTISTGCRYNVTRWTVLLLQYAGKISVTRN